VFVSRRCLALSGSVTHQSCDIPPVVKETGARPKTKCHGRHRLNGAVRGISPTHPDCQTHRTKTNKNERRTLRFSPRALLTMQCYSALKLQMLQAVFQQTFHVEAASCRFSECGRMPHLRACHNLSPHAQPPNAGYRSRPLLDLPQALTPRTFPTRLPS